MGNQNQNQKRDKEIISFTGEIQESLPNAMFKVKLDEGGQIVLGILSGKMKQHFIRVVPGDKVEIEMTPYDLTKGRVTKRL